MAPGIHRLFKREAEAEKEGGEEVEYEDEPTTTLATKIFGKHLHKVRITTPTTTTEGGEEGKWHPTISSIDREFLIFTWILFLNNNNKNNHPWRRRNDSRTDTFSDCKSLRYWTWSSRQTRRENRHTKMGSCGNFRPHLSHHPWHMWILHSTLLPQATLQRWQEGNERRWFEIGTVTWIRL